MKRNSLTTAVVAGIAGVAGFAGLANAVDLNPDGLGQVLIYPYYTVNKGQDTLISVVNTDDVGKAVKVRFLEGYNSREVLDFNLFLSPHDVWTAGVTTVGADHSDTGGAKVLTNDTSCTYPPIASTGQAFSKIAYAGGSIAPFDVPDDGPQDIERTREGYLELISMGDIIPGSSLDAATTHHQTANVPGSGVPSCTTSAISGNAPAASLDPPTGGLFGAGAIVNVGEGTYFGYNADAIDGFTSTTLFYGSSALEPSLQNANSIESTMTARSYIFINGQLLTVDYNRGVDAVSAVFLSDALYNEWIVNPDLDSNTDWVVTFPTKRFYVDQDAYPTGIIEPFEEAFHSPGESNMTVSLEMYDQEEGYTTSSEGFSPPAGTVPNSLPYEVNVISFLDPSVATGTSGVLGSVLNPNVAPYGVAGWLKLGLSGNGHVLYDGVSPDLGAVNLSGLPATGFMVYNLVNENANSAGVLANYAGLFRHRASRSCTAVAPQGLLGPCS